MFRKSWLALFFVAIALAVGLWMVTPGLIERFRGPVTLRGTGPELTIAATGDILLLRPPPSLRSDHGFRDAIAVVKNASAGLANLEEVLLDSADAPAVDTSGGINWAHGSRKQADELRELGFSVISLANNHAMDYGVDGLQQTSRILDRAGLLHTGSGQDLAQARVPVFLGSAGRGRIAVLSVAISASPESRATFSQGEIAGRPGVSGLKYSPNVTLDPATFSTLLHSIVAEKPGAQPDPNQFMLSGTLIRRGEKTVVEFVPDPTDANDLFSRIRAAHAKADLVVIMLHAHEPTNRSQAPADFVEQFARAMVDAGANLVVGQGPHQLRGIEVYKGVPILYSLGNFIFDYGAVDPKAADLYDAGADLYRLALGDMGGSDALAAPHFEEPVWWESVIAVASFEHGVPTSLRLQPVDLGVDVPAANRGTPRLATGARANEILQRLSSLSQPFGTGIRIAEGVGVIDLAN